jgi:hypothetical protein
MSETTAAAVAVEALDREIATVREQIAALEPKLARNQHDSFEYQKIALPLRALQRRLSDLEYRRRCETPADASNRGGSIFYGSN